MKKFIALTLGLSLLGAALIVPMSEASREAYHSYIAKKVRESGRYRHSTYRLGNQKQILFPRKNSVRTGERLRFRRNYLIPRFGKRNLHRSNLSNKNLKVRTSTKRFLGMNVLNQNSNRIVIMSGNSLNKNDFSFVNYNNDLFSVEIPVNSVVAEDNNKLNFNLPLSSIEFSAKKLASKCNQKLGLCGRAVSLTIDHNNDIYRTSKTFQEYQKTDAILGEVGLNNKKFMEGFIGNQNGKDKFFARFILAGKDGDMFLITVESDLEDIDKAVIFAKKVFETFRAKY